MQRFSRKVTRRRFLHGSAAGLAAATIVPRHVLGQGSTPPSEKPGAALIGCGGRGRGTVKGLGDVRMVAFCDVDRSRAERTAASLGEGLATYTDFRRLLERTDVDVVAIATHPGWHALISIASMEAGKDVLCEKPMTRFIAEGRAVVNAVKKNNRIFQIGTYGRFGACRSRTSQTIHNIMKSGLVKNSPGVHVVRDNFKVRQWSGMVNARPRPVPKNLDWDMYCGPSPLRPYHPHRFGGSHRGYWDYEGGGLADMSQHFLDPVQWIYAKDATSPVEIEASAPPAHPEACGMWAWVELKYADGFTLVFDSREWGKTYDRKKDHRVSLDDLPEADRKKIEAMPAPAPLIEFGEAVKTRQQPGGHAEAAHRCATLMHLANLAIRVGRKIRFDPVREQIIGDEQANRLVNQPMRAPWHL